MNLRHVTHVVKGSSEEREIVSRINNFIGWRDLDHAEQGLKRNKELIELALPHVQGQMVLLDQQDGSVVLNVAFGYSS